MKKKPKVFVGMSGGVDSSVSSALLKSAGYDVVGVFIKVWQPEWLASKSVCTAREDRLDAMRVAARLRIPFITLDLEEEYKREVVDYMIEEYKKGRTPNPDVMCNAYVKFGGFYSWAMKNGADFVATGHYARIKNGKDGKKYLLAGEDKNKDQSYFLWTLRKENLEHIIFPVGDMPKPEVRKIAKRFKLPNAEKKDSQGLCFIGKIDIKEFLSKFINEKSGNVLDISGNIIGKHDGAFFFTIGERHGFHIEKKTPNDEPYYIVSKDIENNTITVAHKGKDGELPNGIHEVKLKDVNWISENSPEPDKSFKARSRYRQDLQDIRIKSLDLEAKECIVEFIKPQYSISPGQSIVIYDKDICLGGGIIS